MDSISIRKGLLALSPLAVFLVFYLFLSLVANDFYSVPITVAFLAASLYAVAIVRGTTLEKRTTIFSEGASSPNLLMMIWIFILAGAFASSAKAMGAIQSTVNLCLLLLPPQLLLAGLFLASCFISLSVGTSVGTIVALVPIASGIAQGTDASLPLVVGAVVGGALFGDNLSFISDTTIVATRSQGCKQSDKFRTNLRIVLLPALLVFLAYIFLGSRMSLMAQSKPVDWVAVIPYLLVLLTALRGLNVMLVLSLGLVTSGLVGIWRGSYDLFGWLTAMGNGILGMSELIIVTLMAAGMVGVIRHLGGIDFLLQRLSARISTRRGGELAIAALVVLTDLCTANNTIAILTVGPLAKEISQKYDISPRRSACLLDTFSCFAQGILPYGAQLLMAGGLALLNPIEIIPHLYYPMLMGLFALASIIRTR